MMNKIKTFLLLITGFVPVFAQAQSQYISEDGNINLLGEISIENLQNEPYSDWFDISSEVQTLSEEIGNLLADHRVKIFIGTWCGDSKNWVPLFINTWEKSGLPMENLELIALHNEGNQYKRSPEELEKNLNIHRVPTFIFYKDKNEVGRIVESPINDLTTDLKQIALGVPSKPRYKAVSYVDKSLNTIDLDSIFTQQNYRSILLNVYREVSTSSELNTYGYVLKAQGELRKAEFAFYLNRNLFKYDPNTWDSLAEIYLTQNKLEDALKCYSKVLEIDPKNENANKCILEIQEKLSTHHKP